MTEPLREGDRVYYLTRPTRTGVVSYVQTYTIFVTLDEPELHLGETVAEISSHPALWKKR